MPREKIYDMIIVGSGPAGLSAAIYAESEGRDTLVLEASVQLGGQASQSSMIKNYPGFPGGVSGPRLTSLMIDHALQFNTEFLAPLRAEAIIQTDDGLAVREDSETVLGRTVLVSSGVEYRRLVVPNLAAYLKRGVEYGSPQMIEDFSGKKTLVVGGANSAGQAAMHLSTFEGCNVNLLVRGGSIRDKMSAYLVDEIEATPNINVRTETEVTGVDGDGQLREIAIKSGDTNATLLADNLFVMIGAVPKTGWLPDSVERDGHGFVLAGGDISEDERHAFTDVNGRSPLAHETTVPGLFVAGDVRSGATRRVVSAASDGATTIPDLHKYLDSLKK